MNTKLVEKLILFIAEQLYYFGAPVTTIRIIKILYLTDIEYYKKYKRTLSSINWVRFKYGPYFFEIPQIMQSSSLGIDFEEKPTEQGFTRLFTPKKRISESSTLDFFAEQTIASLIKEWGNVELGIFLDFVYQTPPMKVSVFGKPLDFSVLDLKNITIQKKERHIQLDSKDSLKIQDMLRERTVINTTQQFEFDAEYLDAIKVLDTEDTKENANVSGTIRSRIILSEVLRFQNE